MKKSDAEHIAAKAARRNFVPKARVPREARNAKEATAIARMAERIAKQPKKIKKPKNANS